jgi:outer membrane protein
MVRNDRFLNLAAATMTTRSMERTVRASLLAAFFIVGAPAAEAQDSRKTLSLSVDDALRMADVRSDAVAIARAKLDEARGRRLQALSTRLPQLAAYSSYDRSLRSEFEGIGGFGPDSTLDGEEPPELPFGSANTYRAGLTASYTVFAGGRALARHRSARSAIRVAETGLTSTRAQLRLDVAEAYYDAALAQRLEQIAEWTLAQAESTYCRVALVTQVGRGAEFDLVRAKASRDRQVPVVIRRRAEREIAMLRLRQLVHAPASTDLALSSEVTVDAWSPDSTPTTERAAVRQAAEWVTQSEQSLVGSLAQRLPAVTLTSTYERVAYPRQSVPAWGDTRANWTVGARVDLPLFTGGAQRGGETQARAGLDAARAQLRQTRELAELDAQSAAARLAAAQAAWQASIAGVDEAARAYEIATLRHREGISIQLELADARILLEQARADQARAARDVLVERMRASLLTDLPLGTTSSTTSGAR